MNERDVIFEIRKIVADIMSVSVDDALLLAAEEHFGLEIPDDDAWNVRTVQQTADYIARRLT